MIRVKKVYKNIVAIDPDVDKSGVAFVNRSTKQLIVSSLSFPELLEYLQLIKKQESEQNESVLVVVESGHLIKSNWHLTAYDTKRTAAAKGNSAGRNHETGRKIIEMCKHYDLDTIEQRPLLKKWNTKDGKISHSELASFTDIKGRTNQEERDAALIAWTHAGFPIRINTNRLFNESRPLNKSKRVKTTK